MLASGQFLMEKKFNSSMHNQTRLYQKPLYRFHFLKSWIFAKAERRKNKIGKRINSRQLFLCTYIATKGMVMSCFRNYVPQLSGPTETLQTIKHSVPSPPPPHAPAAGWRQELEIQSINITSLDKNNLLETRLKN